MSLHHAFKQQWDSLMKHGSIKQWFASVIESDGFSTEEKEALQLTRSRAGRGEATTLTTAWYSHAPAPSAYTHP